MLRTVVGNLILAVVRLCAMTTVVWWLDHFLETGRGSTMVLAGAATIAAGVTVALAEQLSEWLWACSEPPAPSGNRAALPPPLS
jgi:hypothetical protein